MTAFKDSCHSANLGKLVRSSEGLFSGKDEVKYLDTLTNMSASIVPEDALRDVLQIGFEKMLDTTMVVETSVLLDTTITSQVFPDSTFAPPTPTKYRHFDSTQVADLNTIAEQCPYEFGVGVYLARAMLLMDGTATKQPAISITGFGSEITNVPAAE